MAGALPAVETLPETAEEYVMPHLEQSKAKRLLEELRIIPWWAYVASALLVAALGWAFGGWYMGKLERASGEYSGMLAWVPVCVVTILWLWFVMIFYVARDARRRRMSVALWTLLVIIIPNALGFIIYFLLREPVPAACPKCASSMRPEFAFCPACGEGLAPTCPSCRHPIEPGWTSCAFCGFQLASER
jgi:hypothetical protein